MKLWVGSPIISSLRYVTSALSVANIVSSLHLKQRKDMKVIPKTKKYRDLNGNELDKNASIYANID